MWPYPGLLSGLEEYNGNEEDQYTAHAQYRDELPAARAALHPRHRVHLGIVLVQFATSESLNIFYTLQLCMNGIHQYF